MSKARIVANRTVIFVLAGLGLVLMVAVVWMVMAPEPIAGDPTSSDPAQRMEAASSLGNRDDQDAVKTLVILAGDQNDQVAVRAVRSLGRQKTELSREALQNLLDSADKARIRGAAAAELGQYEDLDPSVLTNVLSNPKAEPETRAGAAKGLSRLKDRDAVPQLFQALSDPDPKVRLWASTALGKITGRRYMYYAEKPPSQQREVIEAIERSLKRLGYL